MPLIPIPADKVAKARQKGVDIPDGTMYDDQTGAIQYPSESPKDMAPETKGTANDNPSDEGPVSKTVGFIGRQVADAAIPVALGSAAGLGTAGLLTGLGVAAGPVGWAGLGATAIGGYLASRGQNKILKQIASSNPEGMIGQHVARTEQDTAEHPVLASLARLPANVFAPGGSAVPSIKGMISNPGQAAKLGATQAGITAGVNAVTGQPTDLKDLLISGLGGAAFTKYNSPTANLSGVQRQALADKLAQLRQAAPESLPVTERPGAVDPSKLLQASPDALRTIAGKGRGEAELYRTLANLKDLSVPLDQSGLDKLVKEGPTRGYQNVARELMAGPVIDQDLAKQKLASNEAAYQERLKAAGIAGQTAQVPTPEARVTSVTDQGITQPPPTGQAEASARAILGSENAPVDDIASFRAQEKEINKLMTHAEEYPEGSPIRENLVRLANEQRQQAETTLKNALASKASGVPEQPAAVGTSEVNKPRALEEIAPPTEATPGASGPPVAPETTPPPVTQALEAMAKKDEPGKVNPPAVENKGLPVAEPSEQALGIKPRIKLRGPIELLSQLTDSIRQRMKGSEVGQRFTKAMEGAQIAHTRLSEPRYDELYRASEGLPEESQLKVGEYLRNKRDGLPTSELSPDEQFLADTITKHTLEAGLESRDSGPYRYAYDESGKPIRRPTEIVPNFFPAVKSREFQKAASDPQKYATELAGYHEDYINHAVSRGLTPKQAEAAWNAQLPDSLGPIKPGTHARQLYFEQGIGLPRSMEEPNPVLAMRRYINRHALAMGFHQNVESDPVLAKALGQEDLGRGEPVPDVVRTKSGMNVVPNSLRNDPNVAAFMRDYAGFASPSAQKLEALLGTIHVGSVGTVSQAKNVIQNLFTLPELLHPSEYRYIVKGLGQMFSLESAQSALESGAVRSRRNQLPAVAGDTVSMLSKIRDAYAHYTGAELVSKKNDVLLHDVGKMVAEQRILNGDTAFLDRFGPKDWETKTPEEITNYVGTSLKMYFSGAYSGQDLPPGLLKGSDTPFAPFFKLLRWPVARFNRWNETVYEPAKRGEIKPLVASMLGTAVGAGVLNSFTQLLTSRKPKELTWEEYLHLGGPGKVSPLETAYTIFSKADTASTTGLLGSLVFSGIQAASGEAPRGYNNLLLQSIQDTWTRLEQFAGAMGRGDADFSDLGKIALETMKDRLQVVKLFSGQPEDKGTREERIAKRVGYLPPASEIASRGLANPVSESQAYENGDVDQLAKIFQRKAASGIRPEAPDNQLRRSMVLGSDGSPRGYYDFLEAAQGTQAGDAAKDRDIEATQKKRELFLRALDRLR